LYDSLGENAVEYIINHSESSIVFVSKDKLGTLLKALPSVDKGRLTTLVYWGTGNERNAAVEKVGPASARRPSLLPMCALRACVLRIGTSL
jgi:long-chain acyl-CoA synthetase